ncbi:MAG: ribonuclease H, partial [Acidimicrobiia bacterium]
YPGWTPRQCLDCRSKGGQPSSPPAKRLPSKSKNRDLTIEEVLDSFTEGPDTGVFTDGASEGNPGPGGWGAVHVENGEVIAEKMGSDPHTTNNRMELTAMIAGLEMLPLDSDVDVYTDSKLIVDTLNTWAKGWKARGWRRKSGPIANLELVQRAFELYEQRPGVTVKWIPAHSGNLWNEYADALATSYRRDEH